MNTELEEILVAAYRRQAGCYTQALELAHSIDAAVRLGQDQGPPMQHLITVLDEVAAIDADASDARQLWQRSSRRPGPELQAVLDQVANLIQALHACVGSAAQHARAETERLAPQLDRLVRGRQMQAAYRGSMASAKDSRPL
jgi:hypothetical protein